MKIHLRSGVELEVRSDAGRYLGIGSVTINGVPMRNPERCLLPEIRTPEGELWVDLELVDVVNTADEAVLTIRGAWKSDGWMEYMLHTVRNRYRTSDWAAEPVRDDSTELKLVLRATTVTLRGVAHHGFSYEFRYRSEGRPIYRVLDRGTWEPGGTLVGSEIWVRQGIAPAIWRCESVSDRMSSEWYLPPIEQPNIFQFFPLQAAMQGFTMTAAPSGTLFTWAERPAHIRTLLEKRRDVDAYFHWHEHCADLGDAFSTSPMVVVWRGGETDRVERINAHESVREHVWDSLHAQVGLVPERVAPYGVIEEWGMPDFERYREEGVPALASAGVRTVFLPNQFENNMNVWSVGNMCCTVDLKPAESVGPDRIQAFCQRAESHGMRVEMWGNTALSSLTYIHGLRQPDGHPGRIDFLPDEDSVLGVVREAASPWVRNASGAIEADHYTPVFCALNLREPAVVAYWHRKWQEARQSIGIHGIFIDSSFNMSADKFHWRQNAEPGQTGGATIDQTSALKDCRPDVEPRKAIESQYLAYLQLLVEMQRYGYFISTEDVGLFGSSRSGPDLADRLPALPLWQESYCDFDACQAEKPDLAFFAGLAYRVMWKLYWHPHRRELTWRLSGAESDADRPSPRQISWLRAFSVADGTMQRRTVLPQEAGVLWESDGGGSVWAFRELEYRLPVPRRVHFPLEDRTEILTSVRLQPLQLAIWTSVG
ncbi:MAG: hypothetical protein SFX74_12875 [Fimbriimonadaceae bacterium]|nr:hypothetical protein [Fimbriimonadaceae bacterium]